MAEGQACIYILASRRNGTIYLGSAIDPKKWNRAWKVREIEG